MHQHGVPVVHNDSEMNQMMQHGYLYKSIEDRIDKKQLINEQMKIKKEFLRVNAGKRTKA